MSEKKKTPPRPEEITAEKRAKTRQEPVTGWHCYVAEVEKECGHDLGKLAAGMRRNGARQIAYAYQTGHVLAEIKDEVGDESAWLEAIPWQKAMAYRYIQLAKAVDEHGGPAAVSTQVDTLDEHVSIVGVIKALKPKPGGAPIDTTAIEKPATSPAYEPAVGDQVRLSKARGVVSAGTPGVVKKHDDEDPTKLWVSFAGDGLRTTQSVPVNLLKPAEPANAPAARPETEMGHEGEPEREPEGAPAGEFEEGVEAEESPEPEPEQKPKPEPVTQEEVDDAVRNAIVAIDPKAGDEVVAETIDAKLGPILDRGKAHALVRLLMKKWGVPDDVLEIAS